MAESTLDIQLRLVDEATEPIKTSLNGIRTETDKVKESGERAGKTIQQEFKEASNKVRDLRRALFLVTGAMALAIKSVNDLAEYNQEAANTINNFNKAVKTLSATLGTLFEPAIKGLTSALTFFSQTIEAALGGFIKLFSFVFEFLSQLPDAFKNVLDNVKAVFTGEDPIGIVEGFRQSFQRALEVANIATDQILNKMETTRAKIQYGQTLEQEAIQLERINVIKKKTEEANKKEKNSLEGIVGALGELGSALANAEEMEKGFGKAAAAVALGLAIVNTAAGMTRAFKDYPWPLSMVIASIIGVAGAIQVATIAATKFHTGGMIRAHEGLAVDEVPIKAQTGEGILSRRGMRALGGEENLSRLNQGESGGSNITININGPVIRDQMDVRSLADMLGMEIDRQLRYART